MNNNRPSKPNIAGNTDNRRNTAAGKGMPQDRGHVNTGRNNGGVNRQQRGYSDGRYNSQPYNSRNASGQPGYRGSGQYYQTPGANGSRQRVQTNNGYTGQRQQYAPPQGNTGRYYGSGSSVRPAQKQKSVKPRLTKEQKRRIKERKDFERRIKRDHFKRKAAIWIRVMTGRFILSLTAAVIIFAAVIGIIAIDAHYVRRVKENEYAFYIGEKEDRYSLHYVSTSALCPAGDNIPYINMSWITDYFSLITTGDSRQLKYIFNDDRTQTLKFTYGSNLALVNGELAGMESDALKINGDMYIPLSFFDMCFDGIACRIDDDNLEVVFTRTLTDEAMERLEQYRVLKSDNDKKNDMELSAVGFEYLDVSLRMHPQKATSPIAEYSLDADILAATDPEYLAALAAAAEAAKNAANE